MPIDDGYKWNFLPRLKGSMKQGREDSSFNPFKDAEIRCLVREYIQNSIDVPQHKDSVVKVTFDFGSLRCADYPNLIQSLRERMIERPL